MEKATRHDQKVRTRQGLIRAATVLFSKDGIASTSTAAIARKLKLSHGTLFLHFPARENLLLAVMDDFGRELSDALKLALKDQPDVRSVLGAHLKTLARFEDFYFRILTEINALPGSVRGTTFMLNTAVAHRLYDVAQPLMKSGEIKRMDQHLLFNTWISLLQYYIINRAQLGKKAPILEEKGEMLLDHFLALIAG